MWSGMMAADTIFEAINDEKNQDIEGTGLYSYASVDILGNM